MPVTKCEINLILTQSDRCFKLANSIANQEPTVTKTDTQFYVLVVNFSTQENVKLLEKSKSSFKKTINLNKYERKVTAEQQNQYSIS